MSTFMMGFMHIKDRNTYIAINKKMGNYFEELGKIIDLKRLFRHQNVAKNIYLAQKVYENKLVDGRLDESTFLKGTATSHQPVRLTPFGRKAPLAPKTTTSLSHKILNFENWEESQENKPHSENKKD